MNICLIYSPSWLSYIYVEVFAIRKTQKNIPKIYLISDKAGNPGERYCEDNNCTFIDLEEMYRDIINININNRFSRYTLYRLLIPFIIHDSRLLYIDTDAIVNGDLTDLYNIKMGKDLIAGCRDVGILDSQLSDIGLKHGDIYINAGVLLLELDKIRVKGLHHTWIRKIKERQTSCFDQDLINYTCKGHIKLLPNVYNSSLSTGFAPIDKIKIAHYAGYTHEKGWSGLITPMHQIWKDWADRYATDIS